MSYGITGYILRPGDDPDRVAAILNGDCDEQDEYDGLQLDHVVREGVVQCCLRHGLSLESETKESIEYSKGPLQLAIYSSQVSITVPYWDDAKRLVDDAIAIARELAVSAKIEFWDPQDGTWIDGASTGGTFAGTLVKMEKIIGTKRPWWNFGDT